MLLLEALMLINAFLCFLMLRDGVGAAEGWVFAAVLAAVCPFTVREALGGPHIPRPPHWLAAALAFALLVPILGQMNMRFVAEPLLEAILLLFVLRAFERRTPREYVQISLLTMGATVVYAMLSVDRLFLTVCMSMGFFGSMTLMLAAWMKREPDARLSRDDVRRVAWRCAVIFAGMLPLCLLLFFAAPRFRSPFLIPRGGGTGRTGFTDSIMLGGISDIQNSNRLAFRVETEKLDFSPYWRGVVMSAFDGASWSVDLVGRDAGWTFSPKRGERLIRQNIFMEPNGHRWLFTLDRPMNVEAGVMTTYSGAGTFMRRMGGAAQYKVVSSLLPPGGRMSGRHREMFLRLPRGVMPQVRGLVDELTADCGSAREKMSMIMSHLLGDGYEYSMRNLPQGRHALEDFILRIKRGTCEYFASAAAVMLRMSGVPARIVGGYKGGEYNAAGSYYSVRDYMAHVWVEAWDDASAEWVRLDPTPVSRESSAAADDELGGWSEFWDYLDYQWNRYFVTYGGGEQSRIADALRTMFRGRGGLRTPLGGLGSIFSGGAVPLIALVIGGALLLGLAAWQICSFRGRSPEMSLLVRFDNLASRHGFVRSEGTGIEEFSRTLPEGARRPALEFSNLLNEVMYGGRALDEERKASLVGLLESLEEALRA